MDTQALQNLKCDEAALKRAYLDAGGKLGDGKHHNHCPICGDATGFMLGVGQNGFAVWGCFAGKGACAIPPGRKVSGTIVDLIMRVRGIDSKEACKVALELYGRGTSRTEDGGLRTERTAASGGSPVSQSSALSPQSSPSKPKKVGKLHDSVDSAFAACAYGINQRPGNSGARLVKYWKYQDAKRVTQPDGSWLVKAEEPRLAVGRFDLVRNGKAAKEFAPIHRDGNGWRVGLGGRARLCPLYRLPEMLKALGS